MTDKPNGKRCSWLTWIGAVIALFAAYMGAYFATVQSVGWGSLGTWHTYTIGSSSLPWPVHRFLLQRTGLIANFGPTDGPNQTRALTTP